MNIKDLEIGDWVIIHNSTTVMTPISDNEITRHTVETIKTVKVSSIHRNNKIGYMEWSELKNKMVEQTEPVNNIEPFPITEELMLLNGFNENGFYLDESIDVHYVYYNGFRFVISTDDMDLNIVIWTVHELQHALRLCGLTELADNLIVSDNNEKGKNV